MLTHKRSFNQDGMNEEESDQSVMRVEQKIGDLFDFTEMIYDDPAE